MRIIQLVPDISYGDAVSKDILAIDKILKAKGFKSEIYAQSISKNLPVGIVKSFDLVNVLADDILILHVAVATTLNEWITKQKCKKIMIYHNITPPEFFHLYNPVAENCCNVGLSQTKKLKDTFNLVLADSEFNKQNLIEMGYTYDIKVLPILISFDDYQKTPSKEILEKYDDDFTNILFVGRVVPNKKQEDVILAFDAYQKNFNQKSRLFIVGNPTGMENYDERLKKYVEKLGTRNVIFTGHTKFDEILAYYRLSDLFLCQSEHEGFCVPLVESMFFEKPIVAYDCCAIGETLGKGGITLKEKNPIETACVMNRILTDSDLRGKIIQNQNERLADFDHGEVESLFWKYMDVFLKPALAENNEQNN